MKNLKKYFMLTLVFVCTFIIGSGFASAANVTYKLDNTAKTTIKSEAIGNSNKFVSLSDIISELSGTTKTTAQNYLNEKEAAGYDFDGWSVSGKTKTYTTDDTLKSVNNSTYTAFTASTHWNKARSIVTVNGTKVTAADQAVEVKSGTTKQGTVKVTSTYPVAINSAFTINIVPEEGYEIDEINYQITGHSKKTVNGNDTAITGNETTGYNYTISSMTNDCAVEVKFKLKTFNLTLDGTKATSKTVKDSNSATIGTYEISSTTVNYGSDMTIDILPYATTKGYRIKSLKVGGENVDLTKLTTGKDWSGYTHHYYKIEEIKSNLDIVVEFEKIPFTITVEDVTNASIDPSGEITVLWGESQTFTILPNEGYNLVSVKVGDQEKTPLTDNKLVLSNVKADATVTVVVERIEYNVTTSVSGGHGAISDGGKVYYGDDFDVTFTPDTGYMVSEVTVNGIPANLYGNKLTLTEVKGDKDVVVKYTKIPVTLYVDCSDNATIDPAGDASGFIDLFYGDNQTFTIKAKDGYVLSSVLVDGVEKLPIENDKLILENITKDMVVKVLVEKETYEVLDGKNQMFNEKEDLVVRFSGELDQFVKLLVDDKEVDAKNYTKEEGSTIITLSKEYISTLKSGTHKMAAVYANGNSAETDFTIEGNPKTGDNLMMYVLISIASLGSIAGAGLYLNKRNAKGIR